MDGWAGLGVRHKNQESSHLCAATTPAGAQEGRPFRCSALREARSQTGVTAPWAYKEDEFLLKFLLTREVYSW